MSEEKKVLFIEWCAQDALGGTFQMEPLAELAYRRIIDMIYATDDELIDDDNVLSYSTKTGAKWKAIKKALIENHKKIYIENGRIRQAKCTEKLEKAWANIAQRSTAGKASAEKRKALKDKETGSTGVEVPLPKNTQKSSTERQLTNNQEPEERKKVSKDPLTPKGECSAFESFWDAYPKQRAGSRGKARQAYEKAITEKRATAEEINHGVSAYRVSDEVSRGFAKGAAAWLNDDRWKNDYSPPAQRQGGQRDQPKASYMDKIQAAGNKALASLNDRMEAERDAPWNQGSPL